MFLDWLDTDHTQPYNSFGNGSAMRVSYIADYYDDIEDVVANARRSAACTHNHPEGILGAEVTAACIWFAKNDRRKDQILEYAIAQYPKEEYAYSPEIPLAKMREYYRWDVTCQGSVPAVIRCIYEANSYTEFIRNVLSLKCDTDTLCAIGGGIAEELFDNSADPIMTQADEILKKYLDDYLLKIFLEN
jgi:ADP-ribosylglycohydrolase